jgi:Fic family protein
MDSSPTLLKVYDHPSQFEPLLPTSRLDELALRTRPIIERSGMLAGALHPSTRERVRELVRSMNSYYSNLIEGQSTHPLHIEQGLRRDFSGNPDTARRQRIAIAHIEAERMLELQGLDEAQALASATLLRAHTSLYEQLDPEDRLTDDGRVVEPGKIRTSYVAVGRHQPPTHTALPAFLARADQVYARNWGLDSVLYAVASLHHRMTLIHPFEDGNGRAVRLQTHCAMHAITNGLWSVNRGLARRRDDYYRFLSEADMARMGDLDGRGNLSERMLRQWCEFFVDVCEDQSAFMAKMLDIDQLHHRLAALVPVRSAMPQYEHYRVETIRPLHYLVAAGPVSRGEFMQMTGLPERTARRVLSQLLQDGLLISPSPKGEVGIGFPLDALYLLFPNLYPEAAAAVI